MKFKEYDYTIADHWSPALINGDYSGLDDDEIQALENFMSDLPSAWGHWDIPDDYPDFRVDDVTGYFANCVSAVYLVPVGGAA